MPTGVYLHKKFTEEWKKKLSEAHIGKQKEENNPSWKGINAKHSAKHHWVYRHKGMAQICIDCGKIGERINGKWNIDWSNVDHKYLRNLDDYIARCHSCHCKYDMGLKKISMA